MYGWKKDIVSWSVGDTLYLSVPFTWMLNDAEISAKKHKGRVIAGGPAVKLIGAPWADETPDECPYDVLAMHNPLATYTTRGCPNRCGFCAVPKIEGAFRELVDWKVAPVICDNNFLAASEKHRNTVYEKLVQAKFPKIDFNQGLDAYLITEEDAKALGSLNAKVRFAFDNRSDEDAVIRAVELARRYGCKDFGVYVLIGFRDDPDDARYRLEKIRSLGIRPNPMRYQPLDSVQKNSYVGPNWTQRELNKMMRYYSRLRFLEHVSYDEFEYTRDETPLFPE